MHPSTLMAAAAVAVLTSTATAAANSTPSRAEFETRVAGLLAERYGPAFDDAAMRYVKCPAAAFSYDRAYGSQQECRYEFGSPTRRQAGVVSFRDDFGGGGEFTPQLSTNPSFTLGPRTCRGTQANFGFDDPDWTIRSLRATASRRDWCRVDGQVLDRLASLAPRGRRLPKNRTVRSKIAANGFAALDHWTCTSTGTRVQSVSCRNALGHRISAHLTPAT